LVRESYLNPLNTLETNVTGTANVLEAVRQLNIQTNIVVVTSDKCYDNKEWIFGYRENDAFGGYDPYSASKGAAEIVVSSWRNSFFKPMNYDKHQVKLATARAGNVIGGGDWAQDRILPDCIRALQKNKTIQIRNPLATRPWQHVLESLGGYLLLGSKLLNKSPEYLDSYCSGFNFGPLGTSNKTVESLVNEVLTHWQGKWKYNKEDAMHEAFLLNLNIDKATQLLNWSPVWNFKITIEKTVLWYKKIYENPNEIKGFTKDQINEYSYSFFNNLNNF
jgi:CDP-glucose 4,6-dehydratase